jgi:hypothetical protein
MRDMPDDHPLPPNRSVGRPPLWLVIILVFVAIWLGMRIVDHVTDALTGAGSSAPTPAGFARKG